MRYADLHAHTYHSDGTRSPAEVIDVALANGIEIVAISDHDNLAAYFEIKAYADERGVTLVPAAELSCAYEGVDVHILAYAFDPHDERIETRLRVFRDARQTRGRRIVERLRAIGYNISSERVEQLAAGGAVGRPHVARALVEGGYVDSVSDAFDKLLRPGNLDTSRRTASPSEAVHLMHATGGVTSIAHPTLYPDHARIVRNFSTRGSTASKCSIPTSTTRRARCTARSPLPRQDADRRLGRSRHREDDGDAGTIKVPEAGSARSSSGCRDHATVGSLAPSSASRGGRWLGSAR
jgi:predicted metal-dependent phosphoesterase TrpH